MPGATALLYGLAALYPQRVPDSLALALAGLFIAQLPLGLLGGVFAGVLSIEGSAGRRVAVYLGVVGIAAVVGWLGMGTRASYFVPIIALAVVSQVLSLLLLGGDVSRARKRVEAVASDTVNLTILACWSIFAALVIGLVLRQYAAATLARLGIDLRPGQVAWVVAAYFALRAVSAAYVHTAAFARRGNGYFDRPWIEWLVKNLGRSGPKGED
jgi:hypothetical protein